MRPTSDAMRMPRNEGKACDAVVRLLELRSGAARRDIRRPERDHVGPPVDLRLRLGNQEHALEHTLVEPFENHIKTGVVFREIIAYIRANTGDVLPGTPYYELHVPIDVRLPNRKAERQEALSNLVDWLIAGARTMDERNSGPMLVSA